MGRCLFGINLRNLPQISCWERIAEVRKRFIRRPGRSVCTQQPNYDVTESLVLNSHSFLIVSLLAAAKYCSVLLMYTNIPVFLLHFKYASRLLHSPHRRVPGEPVGAQSSEYSGFAPAFLYMFLTYYTSKCSSFSPLLRLKSVIKKMP